MEPSPFCTLHKGTSVILNVFQRADLDDDGQLSRGEFLDFFWDGILTEDEISEIFEEVDIHHTGVVTSSDLCTFLWFHMGSFEPALAALEDVSQAITQNAAHIEKTYSKDSTQNQFVSRFLLKELQHQFTVIQNQLQTSGKKLEENAIPLMDRQSPPPLVANCKKRFPVLPRVKSMRLKKQMVTQTSFHIEDTSQDLDAQVKKLEKLVRQLENQPLLKKPAEVDIDSNEEKLLLLVQQSLPTEASSIDQFRQSLKVYAEQTKSVDGCLHVCIRWYSSVSTFVVYEVWDSEALWNNHVRSRIYKSFQHQNVDCLRKPEFVSVMEIPSSWWQSYS